MAKTQLRSVAQNYSARFQQAPISGQHFAAHESHIVLLLKCFNERIKPPGEDDGVTIKENEVRSAGMFRGGVQIAWRVLVAV